MTRKDSGRYSWPDRLDDTLEALNRFVFGPVAPGESRPSLTSSILVWAAIAGVLAVGLMVTWAL